jgi:hypothetical protein
VVPFRKKTEKLLCFQCCSLLISKFTKQNTFFFTSHFCLCVCVWHWSLNSGPTSQATPPALPCHWFFQNSISQTICLDLSWAANLLTSQVARTIHVSPWCPALYFSFKSVSSVGLWSQPNTLKVQNSQAICGHPTLNFSSLSLITSSSHQLSPYSSIPTSFLPLEFEALFRKYVLCVCWVPGIDVHSEHIQWQPLALEPLA